MYRICNTRPYENQLFSLDSKIILYHVDRLPWIKKIIIIIIIIKYAHDVTAETLIPGTMK